MLINTPFIKEILSKNKIVVIDGGAMGSLFPPFTRVDKSVLTVLRFEPNSESEVIKNDNEIVFNKALWNTDGTITINIAKDPSTSSVFEVDQRILKQVDPANMDIRMPTKKVEVDCCTIDTICQLHNVPYPDFIKLDIHGSEYQALEGAQHSLNNQTFCLLVETWTLPIHKGQRTHGEVEALLNKSGIYLFENFPLMQWTRQARNTSFMKTQIGGYDSLFFKDIIETEASKNYDLGRAVKCIALAELFGHHGLALQIADYFYDIKTIDENLYQQIRKYILPNNGFHTFKTKWLQKIQLRAQIMLNNFTR